MTSRHLFTLDEKIGIIGRLENGGQDAVAVAAAFGASPSRISGIWSRRDTLKTMFETKSRARHKDLERAVLGWYEEQRSANAPVSGPALRAKTDALAVALNVEDFECSALWILRFRQRHNIGFGQLAGESTAAAAAVVAAKARAKPRCGRDHDDVWPDLEGDWSAGCCRRDDDDDFEEEVFAMDVEAIDGTTMATAIANKRSGNRFRSRGFICNSFHSSD